MNIEKEMFDKAVEFLEERYGKDKVQTTNYELIIMLMKISVVQ